jgi:hypothetical protein
MRLLNDYRWIVGALCEVGKAKKVAFIACMRKLLTTLNTMLKHLTRWRTEQSQQA